VVPVLLVIALLLHLVIDALGWSMIRTLPLLSESDSDDPPGWPRVSMIVTACNEADTLGQAMAGKLADDYPDLEIIVVDDRSTDGTSEIVDSFAGVRALHVRELPAGWLGKLNAMQRGLEAATGEWILFSDADVVLAPGTIRRAVARCELRHDDFLAVVPAMPTEDLALEIAYSAFRRSVSPGTQARAVEDPKSKTAAGTGSFNLVRRSALERTEGLAFLKLEPADDVALAQMVKRAGGRSSVMSGRELVEVAWYRSLGEMARGFEKSAFGVLGGYRLTQHVLACALLLFSCLAPFVAMARGGWLAFGGLAVLLVDVATSVGINRFWRAPIVGALFQPLGDLLLVLFMLRAGLVAVARGGVLWRGTLYPLEQLRAGRRFQL
jgi:glycosyltransferase involved in cell wall biosynthesis